MHSEVRNQIQQMIVNLDGLVNPPGPLLRIRAHLQRVMEILDGNPRTDLEYLDTLLLHGIPLNDELDVLEAMQQALLGESGSNSVLARKFLGSLLDRLYSTPALSPDTLAKLCN